ncbi:MAG: hypothetical protein E5Y68_01270, partial [Mesorhizobium sp.]
INRFMAFAVPFGSVANAEQLQRGLHVAISDKVRIPPASIDPTIKNYHWLDLVRGLYDAYDRGAETALLLDFNGNVAEEVSKLKSRDGGDIFVFGSADLTATLMEHGLIDEYHLGINPVILGKGTPLFKGGPSRIPLKHLETKTLKSGVVILHYAPESRQ